MSAVVDFPVKPEARPYVDGFRELAHEPDWLNRFRKKSLSRFAELGFPSRRAENWRYLDLQGLREKPLPPSVSELGAPLPDGLTLDAPRMRLFLDDGVFSPVLSQLRWPAGVWVGSMNKAIEERPDLVQAVLADADVDHPFSALNAAFFFDGFVLHLAPGVVLDEPIEIIHTASPHGSLHTRSLINLGAGSRATIIETYAGDGHYWRNDFVVCNLSEDATLTRIALVEEGAEAVHFGEVVATLGAGASLDAFALLLGGGMVRHEANVTLAGNGATCRIDGAYLLSGRDEANIVTTIDHQALGGTTSELIKGVAAGRSHGAFQGKIIVREGAQQTDARQTSRNLILGRRAVIDTKPELEILADDVKCAHGASVGELDETALFYLRSRGIPTEEARRLLVEGFLREPIDGIADPAIREHLSRRLSQRLARLEEWS